MCIHEHMYTCVYMYLSKQSESIMYQSEYICGPTFVSKYYSSLMGSRASKRNVWFQNWKKEGTRWPENFFTP
jgi:hypothetical protein